MAFNKNHIIDDDVLTSVERDFNIRGFLLSVNSPLLEYDTRINFKIREQANTWTINPKLILVKLQVEQSLITKVPHDHSHYDWALGIGKTDSGSVAKFKGFENQIAAFGHLFKGYLDQKSPKNVYVGDWVGRTHSVSDGRVTVKNIATAALYKYTPWIGNTDYHGYKAPFGNYLLWLVAKRWFKELIVDKEL